MFVYQPPAEQGFELQYKDKYLLVVSKAAGLLSVPGRGEDKVDSLLTRLKAQFVDALIVHRLDMDTSGLLVLARNAKVHAALSVMFSERKVHKRYIAVVHGAPEQEEGEINLPMIVDWPNRPLQKIDFEQGKPALTRYRVLSRESQSARIELEPFTGRTHQLRLHMASIQCPIWGDTLYGGEVRNAAPRLLLHAWQLGFKHPVTGHDLNFENQPPF